MSGSKSAKRRITPWLLLAAASLIAILALLYVNSTRQGNGQYQQVKQKRGMAKFVRHESPKAIKTFNFVDNSGKTRTLADWKGRVVLLNLWATWCPPCRAEMPTLNRLQQEMGSDDFEVVALSVDKGGLKVPRKFMKENGFAALKIYNDKKITVRRALGVRGYPMTVLISRDGLEIGRLTGPAEWDSDEAKKLVREALGG